MIGSELNDLIFWNVFELRRAGLLFFGVHVDLLRLGDVADAGSRRGERKKVRRI